MSRRYTPLAFTLYAETLANGAKGLKGNGAGEGEGGKGGVGVWQLAWLRMLTGACKSMF